ncbi:hypothetical protein CsatA_020357 [Cannabis sativa]
MSISKRLSSIYFVFHLLLLLCSHHVFSVRPIILMEVNKAPANYVSFDPNKDVNSGGQGGFGRRPEVESCLPKGFRQTSAPSRYVNYDTLGSTLCSSPTSDHRP